MKCLVTNDDGIVSPGLWSAVEALRDLGEVVVVAPDREQSGQGGAVTLNAPVRVSAAVPAVAGIETYAVEGTPADSVTLGLESLVTDVDLVVAGINMGANLGVDVLVSGTVGAALQGYFRGIPSVAISVASLHSMRFDAAARLLRALASLVAEESLPRPLLLNVNLPPIPPEQVEGVDVTRLARRTYADTVREGDDGKRTYYWITRTRPAWVMEEGTDVWAIRHHRISLTPLQTDVTVPAQIPLLSALPDTLLAAVRPPG